MKKEYRIIQRQFETPGIINSYTQNIASARERQLIERLKEYGFEFETRHELEEFAKTRCMLEVYRNKLNRLTVDNILIAEWWDTVDINHEGNKVTAICGKPPSNYL